MFLCVLVLKPIQFGRNCDTFLLRGGSVFVGGGRGWQGVVQLDEAVPMVPGAWAGSK